MSERASERASEVLSLDSTVNTENIFLRGDSLKKSDGEPNHPTDTGNSDI